MHDRRRSPEGVTWSRHHGLDPCIVSTSGWCHWRLDHHRSGLCFQSAHALTWLLDVTPDLWCRSQASSCSGCVKCTSFHRLINSDAILAYPQLALADASCNVLALGRPVGGGQCPGVLLRQLPPPRWPLCRLPRSAGVTPLSSGTQSPNTSSNSFFRDPTASATTPWADSFSEIERESDRVKVQAIYDQIDLLVSWISSLDPDDAVN